MQNINNHYEGRFEKFADEVEYILKPLNLPYLQEASIITSITEIYIKQLREERDYLFDMVKKLLIGELEVGEQNR